MFAIDISKWNGTVDFKAMQSNVPKVDLVIIRASEGDKNADPKLQGYVNGCNKYGFPINVYHFATWNDSDEVGDSTKEAQFLIKCLDKAGLPRTTKVWLDTESNKTNIILSREEMKRYIETFFEVLRQNGWNDYGIYAGKGFVSAFYPLPNPFGNIDLWVASYNGKTKPTMPPGWNKYYLWQYTDKGTVKGIKTQVDLNRGPA